MMEIIIKIYKFFLLGIIFIAQNIAAQDVIFTSNAILNITPNATLVFSNGGKFVNNSATSKFDGKFIFTGIDTLGIGGTQSTEFSYLSLENGAIVKLTSDIDVSKQLNLTGGVLKLGSNYLKILSGGSIAGNFSETSMIAADGTGKLVFGIPANGTYLFPVGEITQTAEYSPAKFTLLSGTYDNAEISVNLKNLKHPSNTSTTNYLKRYWVVNQSGISNLNCDVEFHYLNADIAGNESNIYGGKWNGSFWIPLNKVSLNTITGNVNSFSDFTGGEQSVLSIEIPLEDKVEILVDGHSIIIHLLDNIELEKLEIYNYLGQKVYVKDIGKSSSYHFELDSGPGIYVVKISGNEKFMSKKIALN